MANHIHLAVLLILMTIISCADPSTKTQSNAEVTKSVLDHHLRAVGDNDLEAIVSDYTEESIIMTPDSVYKGLDQIKAFFEALLPNFPAEGTSLEMKRMSIENDLAYITWRTTTPTLKVPFGTDTFIIKNGKIKQQTFAGVLNPRDMNSYHMACNQIPPNPKTGFTNLSGLGGMSIGYLEVPAPTDFTPLFEGLPQDMCNSPHWGYIIEGSIRLKYEDGKEETVEAGEVFYWPAPHTAMVDKSVKLVDFSPDEEFVPLMDHIAEKLKDQRSE